MTEITEIIIVIFITIALLTAIYHVLPFRICPDKKPGLSFFPKYLKKYGNNLPGIKANLERLGFQESNENTFRRGKIYGDFSARSIKITVSIYPDQNQIRVGAGFMGIFFDTGDLWQLTSDIVSE